MASSSSLCFSHGVDFASSNSGAYWETVSAPNVVALVFMVWKVLGDKAPSNFAFSFIWIEFVMATKKSSGF